VAVICAHCGEEHPDDEKFCPATGKPVVASAPLDSGGVTGRARFASATGSKGVFDLLQEAVALYRAHARTILITAALLFIPGSLIHSCAISLTLGPVLRADPKGSELARRGEELARRGEQLARSARSDPESARAYHEQVEALGREAEETARFAVGGGVSAFLLGLMGWAITALILYGLVLPLTHGALTIAVADRYLGGNASWREYWMLLLRRLGLLLSAIIPAAVVCMLGYFVLVVPGLVLSFFFTFLSPVVLIERKGGLDALKRSFELVRSDWLRTALMIITFAILSAVAHKVAHLFVPRSMALFGTFLGDVLLLLVMPVPIIGSVLLYFDIRRKVDGLDDRSLRSELEALRSPE
jgi:hypothetical protein